MYKFNVTVLAQRPLHSYIGNDSQRCVWVKTAPITAKCPHMKKLQEIKPNNLAIILQNFIRNFWKFDGVVNGRISGNKNHNFHRWVRENENLTTDYLKELLIQIIVYHNDVVIYREQMRYNDVVTLAMRCWISWLSIPNLRPLITPPTFNFFLTKILQNYRQIIQQSSFIVCWVSRTT